MIVIAPDNTLQGNRELCVSSGQRMGGGAYVTPSCVVFHVLERDCAARRLQDHKSVERGDVVVVVDVCIRVPAAGSCELEYEA